jgi:hypothetical protein
MPVALVACEPSLAVSILKDLVFWKVFFYFRSFIFLGAAFSLLGCPTRATGGRHSYHWSR